MPEPEPPLRGGSGSATLLTTLAHFILAATIAHFIPATIAHLILTTRVAEPPDFWAAPDQNFGGSGSGPAPAPATYYLVNKFKVK